jgi:hypothetical protein
MALPVCCADDAQCTDLPPLTTMHTAVHIQTEKSYHEKSKYIIYTLYILLPSLMEIIIIIIIIVRRRRRRRRRRRSLGGIHQWNSQRILR